MHLQQGTNQVTAQRHIECLVGPTIAMQISDNASGSAATGIWKSLPVTLFTLSTPSTGLPQNHS